jgi:hypothetical protein
VEILFLSIGELILFIYQQWSFIYDIVVNYHDTFVEVDRCWKLMEGEYVLQVWWRRSRCIA